MSLALTLRSVERTRRSLKRVYEPTFSGNYVNNGDTMNLLTATGDGPHAGPELPDYFQIENPAGGLEYKVVPGTTNANHKVVVMGQQPTSATASIIPFDQLAVAAYPAGVTTDDVAMRIVAVWKF